MVRTVDTVRADITASSLLWRKSAYDKCGVVCGGVQRGCNIRLDKVWLLDPYVSEKTSRPLNVAYATLRAS
jgi:hypothetical protein